MDFYRFAMTNFQISQTRSLHEDSLHLSHAVYADGDAIASSLVSLGDFNNGDFNTEDFTHGAVGLTGVVINDPQVKVSFIVQLINAGNVPAGTLDGRVAATADQLSGIAAGLQGAAAISLGAGAIPVALTLEAFANIWSWLNADCDGPVAADQLSGPRYLIDAWADDDPTGTITITRHYPGSDSPTGCGGNSDYHATWLVQHYRGWAEILDGAQSPLRSGTGVTAAAHNGAVHVFGVMPGTAVTHARTFTGASWYVDNVDLTSRSDLPVSAVSFNDRLYVVGVRTDGSIWPQAFTVDGGSWATPTTHPAGLQTNAPIATAVFRNRLYVFARSAADNSLQVTSTADLLLWTAWAVVPTGGLGPSAPVAAAALGDRLYVFGLFDTRKPPETGVIVRNATSDGTTWTGWQLVEEAGARPEGHPLTDQPLDVAATAFGDRVYLASRWQPADGGTPYLAANFSADGDNWSGWREPPSTVPFAPAATPGLAGVGNHLYILAPQTDSAANDSTLVWAH